MPHPVRGTVSLVEWHMARARNHIHVLEVEHGAVDGTGYRQLRPVYRRLYLQRSLTAASSRRYADALSPLGARSALQVRVCACFRIAGA
ncbi:DUF484 family protein [Shigella flexneri]